MEGHKLPSPVTVHRVYAPTRLSDDLLAQAYDHVLHGVSQVAPAQETDATPPTRRRKPVSRVATTGGPKT